MKQNFLAGLLGSFVGVVLLLMIMNATGWVNAQGPGPQKEGTDTDRITVEAQPLDPTGGGGPNTPLGTTFTYQGQLKVSGVPYTGNCDLQFTLWNGAPGSGGISITTVSALPAPTSVNAGLFTTYVDFGDQFKGDYRQIEPLIRCPSGVGAYQSLGAQVIYGVPYALGLRAGATISGSSPFGLIIKTSSANGDGLHAEANNGPSAYGVSGYSSSGFGVVGTSSSATGAGVSAWNDSPGAALQIVGGGIQVRDAGLNTQTPVFIHQVTASNLCAIQNYSTVIDNAFINGRPDAILIVTPNFGANNTGVAPAVGIPAVYYDATNQCGNGAGRWVIYNLNSTAQTTNSRFNVLAVTP
jgi:hypothetical protein